MQYINSKTVQQYREGMEHVPSCTDKRTYEWWLEAARVSRVTSFCVDCTVAYQAEMTKQGRCEWPGRTITEEEDDDAP